MSVTELIKDKFILKINLRKQASIFQSSRIRDNQCCLLYSTSTL